MSGTTMSTPSNSDSGNIRPASMTMMSSPQRTAMQFMPNSPSPPRGTTWSLPVGMRGDVRTDDANTTNVWLARLPSAAALEGDYLSCGVHHHRGRLLLAELALPARDHDRCQTV